MLANPSSKELKFVLFNEPIVSASSLNTAVWLIFVGKNFCDILGSEGAKKENLTAKICHVKISCAEISHITL